MCLLNNHICTVYCAYPTFGYPRINSPTKFDGWQQGLVFSVVRNSLLLIFPLSGSYVSPLSYSEAMTTKRRPRITNLVCPGCSEVGTLRRIIYGMPDPESFDFEKHAVGGCCINEDGSDPDIRCRACDWSGFLSLFQDDQN